METTTKFSIKRVGMTGRFYMPRLYRQTIVYAVFSLLAGILLTYVCHNLGIILFSRFTAFAFSLMTSLGPLAFATRDSLVTETSLPATGSEKSAFMFLYCFVLIPMLLLLPFSITVLTGADHLMTANTIMPSILNFIHADIQASATSHIMYTSVATAVCMLGVWSFRRRRVIHSLLMVFGTYVLIGISNMVHALTILEGLYEKGTIGKSVYSVENDMQLLDDLTEVITMNRDLFGSYSLYGICELSVLAIAIAILLPAIYHKIKNRQI